MRARIEEEVEKNPGISFTELKSSLGIANGQLQYHLSKADVKKVGKKYVSSEECKDCPVKHLCTDKCILGVLRDERRRKIAKMVDEGLMKKDIASSLGIDCSTLSYHVNLLKDQNILEGGSLRPEVSSLKEF